MTQHAHSQFVEGCYRCELSADEAAAAIPDLARLEELAEAYGNGAELSDDDADAVLTAAPSLLAAARALDEVRDRWKSALEREGNLASAVADVVWKATQYGMTEDGDTFVYIVPKGAIHRLVGVAQSNGAHVPVAFRAALGTGQEGRDE